MNILTANRDKLERLAQELLEKEVIYAEELHNILNDNGGNNETDSSEIGESATNES
jgi:ATP-dependent Zn protease